MHIFAPQTETTTIDSSKKTKQNQNWIDIWADAHMLLTLTWTSLSACCQAERGARLRLPTARSAARSEAPQDLCLSCSASRGLRCLRVHPNQSSQPADLSGALCRPVPFWGRRAAAVPLLLLCSGRTYVTPLPPTPALTHTSAPEALIYYYYYFLLS